MIRRGDIHWVDLGEPTGSPGSRAGKRRPVLIVQSTPYNASRVATVITSNTGLAAMPGNVFLPAIATGLPRDSVVNVTAIVTLTKDELGPPAATVPAGLMADIDQGGLFKTPTSAAVTTTSAQVSDLLRWQRRGVLNKPQGLRAVLGL